MHREKPGSIGIVMSTQWSRVRCVVDLMPAGGAFLARRPEALRQKVPRGPDNYRKASPPHHISNDMYTIRSLPDRLSGSFPSERV